MTFTIDEMRSIITSTKVVELAGEMHRPPSDLYNLRTIFNRFLGVNRGYVSSTYIPFFQQLKDEGITKVARTPMTDFARLGGMTTAALNKGNAEGGTQEGIDPNRRDPVAEMEIAFNTFKEKMNELIPLVVEEQVKEAIFRASLKGTRKTRILR